MSATLARPTRRTLVRSAAWSVPVVSLAAAAPAFALTCTGAAQGFALTWANTTFTESKPTPTGLHTVTATAKGPVGSTDVVATFRSSVFGVTTRAPENLTITGGAIGGLGSRALQLSHTGFQGGFNNRELVQISFDRAVTGLSFSMSDVDSVSGGYYDRVTLDGTRSFVVGKSNNGSDGNYVRGDGTNVAETSNAVGPWRHRDTNSNLPSSSNEGNVTVTYSGTIPKNTVINLNYWSATAGTAQQVFLGNFTFTTPAC